LAALLRGLLDGTDGLRRGVSSSTRFAMAAPRNAVWYGALQLAPSHRTQRRINGGARATVAAIVVRQ
jgi:hypothetical protein